MLMLTCAGAGLALPAAGMPTPPALLGLLAAQQQQAQQAQQQQQQQQQAQPPSLAETLKSGRVLSGGGVFSIGF
jgi:hypothetical protein